METLNKLSKCFLKKEQRLTKPITRIYHHSFNFYETPLYNAVCKGNIPIVRKLLEKGANPNNNKDKSKIPLHFACECGKTQIIELLLKHNADIESKDYTNVHSIFFSNKTPLMVAVNQGHIEIVELLIQKGANINVVNDDKVLFIQF